MIRISLKAARVNAGLSKEKAAKRINITERTLSNYENGTTSPDINTAYVISEVYGININNIFFGKIMRDTERGSS